MTTKSSEVSDELWVRRFLTKTSFVFGFALGLLVGVVLTFRTIV